MDRIDTSSISRAASAGGLLYAFGHTPGTVSAQGRERERFSDYKALVCVYLLGGNDSWNMVVPRRRPSTTRTQRRGRSWRSRGTAVADHAARTLRVTTVSTRRCRAAAAVRVGQCAFIANVGPLCADDARRSIARSLPLPPQLFSHNEQQDQWYSLRGRGQSNTGWAGRVADPAGRQTPGQQLPVNVSLAGNIIMQAGERRDAVRHGTDGRRRVHRVRHDRRELQPAQWRSELIRRKLRYDLRARYADVQQRALAVREARQLGDGRGAALPTSFPNSARSPRSCGPSHSLIAVRDRLDMSRQIFFISAGGFDTHDEQARRPAGLFGSLSRASRRSTRRPSSSASRRTSRRSRNPTSAAR